MIVAVHEVNARVPHLAVFYDSTLAFEGVVDDGRLAFAYFREQGYQPLGSDSLAAFLSARVLGSRIAQGGTRHPLMQ